MCNLSSLNAVPAWDCILSNFLFIFVEEDEILLCCLDNFTSNLSELLHLSAHDAQVPRKVVMTMKVYFQGLLLLQIQTDTEPDMQQSSESKCE